jgi:hypothetical protein
MEDLNDVSNQSFYNAGRQQLSDALRAYAAGMFASHERFMRFSYDHLNKMQNMPTEPTDLACDPEIVLLIKDAVVAHNLLSDVAFTKLELSEQFDHNAFDVLAKFDASFAADR